MDEELCRLIVSGGDSRSQLKANGSNKYLCPFLPSDMISFASSTASPLSCISYDVARSAASAGPLDGWHVLEQQIRVLLNLSNEIRITFCNSGTDAQLAALKALKARRVVVACCEETGSGTAYVAKVTTESGVVYKIIIHCCRVSCLTEIP
jgi:hypothetical protein